jgi:hypothetical protein
MTEEEAMQYGVCLTMPIADRPALWLVPTSARVKPVEESDHVEKAAPRSKTLRINARRRLTFEEETVSSTAGKSTKKGMSEKNSNAAEKPQKRRGSIENIVEDQQVSSKVNQSESTPTL